VPQVSSSVATQPLLTEPRRVTEYYAAGAAAQGQMSCVCLQRLARLVVARAQGRAVSCVLAEAYARLVVARAQGRAVSFQELAVVRGRVQSAGSVISSEHRPKSGSGMCWECGTLSSRGAAGGVCLLSATLRCRWD